MQTLLEQFVAAEDLQEFAHDHAEELLHALIQIEEVVAGWEGTLGAGSIPRDKFITTIMNAFAAELRGVMS